MNFLLLDKLTALVRDEVLAQREVECSNVLTLYFDLSGVRALRTFQIELRTALHCS
jgi:hypothetical protein